MRGCDGRGGCPGSWMSDLAVVFLLHIVVSIRVVEPSTGVRRNRRAGCCTKQRW